MLSSDKIKITYQSSLATGSECTVSLRMPDILGFVRDVKLLLNRYGEATGDEAKLDMPYDEYNSKDGYSIFSTTTSFSEVGYHTFCFKLFLNDQEKTITFNPDSEEGVLSRDGYYWEIFVYDSNFKTPDEIKGGTMYQIYGDRFASSNLPDDEKARTVSWDAPIEWEPDSEGEYHNRQFYGGNLQGIIDHIDYFLSLHVTVVYLTPIFKSSSTHRYDTDDYSRIDSMVGDWDKLEELRDKLNKVGILLVLDLVLNHSGINNDLLSKHPEMYYWEDETHPKGWMGYTTLPEFNKESPLYFALLEKVFEKCARYCDGVRLDVADYMPDFVLVEMNKLRIKYKIKYLFGEVWDCAVDKGRGFLNGTELDGVMNYRFGNGILWYTVAGNAEILKYMTQRICNLYPKPALAVSPIFVSSHDTPRLTTSAVGDFMKKYEVTRENCFTLNFWDIDKNEFWWENDSFNTYKFRKWEADHNFLPPEKRQLAFELQKLIAFLQYTFPGLPALFAGDELGLWGYKDPQNRKTMPWEIWELFKQYKCIGHQNFGEIDDKLKMDFDRLEFYQNLGKFRSEHRKIFAQVDKFKPLYASAFHFVYSWEDMLFLSNAAAEEWHVDLDLSKPLFSTSAISKNQFLPPHSGIVLDRF